MTNKERNTEIKSYKKSITKLNQMRKIYDTEENLCGGFASDMYLEIDSQIKHCKEVISNLEENMQKEMTVAEKQKQINKISKSGNITMTQARKSLLTKKEAIARCEELILKNWGSLESKMDIAQLLKKFNFMGFHGQPIGIKDLGELYNYMVHISEETLEENGWL
ncbi:MAG: hypothetical protein GY849_02590 [Deltaproteobacteria bacterium]|nr:hypothetical protein [Deltaproteobacteria bacterium]